MFSEAHHHLLVRNFHTLATACEKPRSLKNNAYLVKWVVPCRFCRTWYGPLLNDDPDVAAHDETNGSSVKKNKTSYEWITEREVYRAITAFRLCDDQDQTRDRPRIERTSWTIMRKLWKPDVWCYKREQCIITVAEHLLKRWEAKRWEEHIGERQG